MDKRDEEKIRNLAKNYLKKKTLKDKIKFVVDNPLTEDKKKLNFLNFMWRTRVGNILILFSIFLVSILSSKFTTDYQNGLFLIGIPLYLYFLFKSMDWLD